MLAVGDDQVFAAAASWAAGWPGLTRRDMDELGEEYLSALPRATGPSPGKDLIRNCPVLVPADASYKAAPEQLSLVPPPPLAVNTGPPVLTGELQDLTHQSTKQVFAAAIETTHSSRKPSAASDPAAQQRPQHAQVSAVGHPGASSISDTRSQPPAAARQIATARQFRKLVGQRPGQLTGQQLIDHQLDRGLVDFASRPSAHIKHSRRLRTTARLAGVSQSRKQVGPTQALQAELHVSRPLPGGPEPWFQVTTTPPPASGEPASSFPA